MTSQIDFSKALQATTTGGGKLNFVLNEKIPGHQQIAVALQAIADANASQRTAFDIKKFDALDHTGKIDVLKLKSSSMTVGNY